MLQSGFLGWYPAHPLKALSRVTASSSCLQVMLQAAAVGLTAGLALGVLGHIVEWTACSGKLPEAAPRVFLLPSLAELSKRTDRPTSLQHRWFAAEGWQLDHR